MSGCSIHYPIIKELEHKIIVSAQASSDEPFYPEECMLAMAKSVINGGAGGLRLAGEKHIKSIRSITKLPIIGITKPEIIPVNYKEIVYITPTFSDAKKIKDAGADIISLDATSRPRPKENLEEIIQLSHNNLNCPLMADISTFDEGLKAQEYGFDIVATTLAGYTSYTKSTDGPDFDLLKKLVSTLHIPVILEGRIETIKHVKKAFDLGAYALVIGSVITRPHLITKKFVEAVK